MPTVTLTIPKMLASLVRSERTLTVEAATVGEVVNTLTDIHPELRVHLFDESGAIRQHVLLFHNEHTVARDSNEPVSAGDRVTVLQAVSGGAPHIEQIPHDEAEGLLKREFDVAMVRAGRIWNIVAIQSLNPPVLRDSIRFYSSIMFKDSPLSRAQREMLAVVTSQVNECVY